MAMDRCRIPTQGGRTLPFVKMQGCGNDYIYIDCFDETVEDPEAVAKCLSDRHFGVGGDGVVLICPSEVADARMRMFNLDGSEGLMCGNAIRCVGKYLHDIRGVHKTEVTVETRSGIKSLRLILKDGLVDEAEVDMGMAELTPQNIPVALPGEAVVDVPASVAGGNYRITCVSMGNPHCVVFCDQPDALRLEELGPRFEHDPLFPERVNTEFVQVVDDHTLRMRVWERGSGETLACGTGACASVVAAVLCHHCPQDQDVQVLLRGGTLTIRYRADGRVLMRGRAEFAFEGRVVLREGQGG
jgi:carbamoyl-phosphate synthase large subunit